jgi:hypothetical protein
MGLGLPVGLLLDGVRAMTCAPAVGGRDIPAVKEPMAGSCRNAEHQIRRLERMLAAISVVPGLA